MVRNCPAREFWTIQMEEQMRQQGPSTTPFRLAIMPGMADLYNRLWPGELVEQVENLTGKVAAHFNDAGIDVEISDVICTREQCVAACEQFADADIDLLVVALAPYCPSGVFVPVLKNLKSTPKVITTIDACSNATIWTSL